MGQGCSGVNPTCLWDPVGGCGERGATPARQSPPLRRILVIGLTGSSNRREGVAMSGGRGAEGGKGAAQVAFRRVGGAISGPPAPQAHRWRDSRSSRPAPQPGSHPHPQPSPRTPPSLPAPQTESVSLLPSLSGSFLSRDAITAGWPWDLLKVPQGSQAGWKKVLAVPPGGGGGGGGPAGSWTRWK